MRVVTYSVGVSLDGFIVGPDGGFGWTAPDEEVFQSHIAELGGVAVHLLGRRLDETMLYWQTADRIHRSTPRSSSGAEPKPDGVGIAETRWISRAELPALCESRVARLPGWLSIAHYLILLWYGQDLPTAW